MSDKSVRLHSMSRQAKEMADAVFAENDLALRAYQMRSAGKSWWDIAEELGISEGQAGSLVAAKIAAASRLVDEGAKKQMLTMEVERLDQLQLSLWDRALGGELRAVDAVLRIITTRAKILGLETAANSGTVTNNTIVVAGNTDEYVAALRAATNREAIDAD